jgi:hypothetical protein
MVEVAQADAESLTQSGGRESIEDLMSERSGIRMTSPGGLAPGLDQHGGGPAGTAVRDVLPRCLSMGASLGVAAEQQTALGEMQVQPGGVEAEAAGLVTVRVGRHLVLSRRHDLLSRAAAGIAERGQGTKLTPGQDLGTAQWRVGVPSGLASQL